MYKEHLKNSNQKSKLAAEKRVYEAYNYWLNDKSHIKKIAISFKTDPSKLTKYILSKGHKLSSFNDNVFESIENEDQAYWLGFLYADGYINEKRNQVEISLQLSDKQHLEKFYTFLKCNREVKTDSFRCRASASSKKLVNDLVELGCIQKKSFVITFPKLSVMLMHHFIRGYFDGDGTITKGNKLDIKYSSVSICSGSKEFIQELVNMFNIHTNSKCKQVGHKSKSANVYIVTFKNNLCKKFLNWIYKDATIYMDRKYNRFLDSIAV
jgi:hypothetical protein